MAILVLAAFRIINPVAVANIEAVLGAVLPDRVLNEPGKSLRKRWIELSGIDVLGNEHRHGSQMVTTERTRAIALEYIRNAPPDVLPPVRTKVEEVHWRLREGHRRKALERACDAGR